MSLKNSVEYKINANQKYHVVNSGYQGITLIYILKGEVNITCEQFCQTLHSNDILLINQSVGYILNGHDSNIVLTLEIADYYCARYYQNYFKSQYSLGEIEASDIKKQYVDDIRLLLANIMISHIKESNESLLEINYSISHLLLILISFFRIDSPKLAKKDMPYSSKIKNVIQFLEANYNKHLSLYKVAQREYISVSYLSRLFKKEVGVGFIEYITKIKFKHATYDLINTKLPIYIIAEKHGFYDVKQFTKLFKAVYKTTPKKYRLDEQLNKTNVILNHFGNENKENIKIEKAVTVAELLPLFLNIINNKTLTLNNYSTYYDQMIDLTKYSISEKIPTIPHIVFIGELKELSKERVKQQILTLKETTHINYVEVSHLISGKTILPEFITDEPIQTQSPYYYSDLAISFLHKHNIALFVRMYHSSVKTFKNDYINKIIKFFKYYIHSYGIKYVQSWQFIYYVEESEFKNESINDIFDSLIKIRETIKLCLPESKVGLFCPTISNGGSIDEFCRNKILQSIDFIGYSSAPYQSIEDSNTNNCLLENRLFFLQEKAQKIKSFLKKKEINVPIYLMQWNTFTGNTRHTNGSYFRGALIFQALLSLYPYIDAIGMVLNTEMQQEENKPNFIDTTTISLFYLFNSKRPLFFVMKFLGQLKGKIIAKSLDYVITENPNGYQIILTNISLFNPQISIEDHLIQKFKQQRLISIIGIKSGCYQIKKYVFDKMHGSVYHQYLNSPTQFGYDEELIKYIDSNTTPELLVYDENIKGKWQILAKLDINALHFYELKRIDY